MTGTIRMGNAGLRGEIGAGLTPEMATDYASALGTYLGGGTVVVGRDTRISSPMLRHAAVAALLSCGCDVIDAKIISAPRLQHLVSKLGAAGGLLIGAGHHPGGWNALVALGSTGAYFNTLQQQALYNIYDSKRFDTTPWNRIGTVVPPAPAASETYLAYLLNLLDVEAIKARRLKVVMDFCNGSGVVAGMQIADALGLEVVPINDENSGVLPHLPEPRPRAAAHARSLVKALGADVGFVFNSDMSRMSTVTDTGEPLSEEYTFPLVAAHVLARAPTGSMLVTNICTTRTLDDVAARYGADLHKTPVGQAAIIDAMVATGAILAGDGSGSVARSGLPAFDGFMAMGMLLEAIAVQGEAVSQIAQRLPRYHLVKKTIPCRSARASALLGTLGDQFDGATASQVDGLRLDWPDGWLHFRLSSTEPTIRMITEWTSQESAEDMAFRARALIEREVVGS